MGAACSLELVQGLQEGQQEVAKSGFSFLETSRCLVWVCGEVELLSLENLLFAFFISGELWFSSGGPLLLRH